MNQALTAAAGLVVGLAALTAVADNLTTKAVQGGGANWTGVIWQTNGTGTTVGNPVPENTYQLVANGTVFGENKNNTRVRNPATAGLQTFAGGSLTMDAYTEIRAKQAGAILNFPGVGGNPGLILNGGALNAGDSTVFEFQGRIQVASPSLISPGNNGAGAVTAGRGIKFNAKLTGAGALYVIQAPINVASMEVVSTDNTNYTGEWIVKAGYLKGTGSNSLGMGDITVNPAVAVPASLVDGTLTLTAGPAQFEPMYNVNSPGRLTLANGGLMLLHQNCAFDGAILNGTTLGSGLHPYAELAAAYPANFAAGGSGSLFLGPLPPTLVALASNNAVFLSWAAIPRMTNYVIKRGGSSQGPFDLLGSTAGTTLADPAVVNGTTYYYVIASQSGKGSVGVDSAPLAATPVPPPNAPASLTALNGDTSVTLNWSTAPTALSYNIKRATTSGGPYTLVTNTTALAMRDVGLNNGTIYYYVVSAVNGAGESGDSGQVSGRPNVAPSGLTATAGAQQVTLSWNALPGAASYNVKRATSSGGPYEAVATGLHVLSHQDSPLAAGTTYFYVVSAQMDPLDPNSESPISAEGSATTAPGAPANLIANATADIKVNLTWSDANPVVSSFKIERSSDGITFAEVATVPASQTNYTDNAMSILATYTYRVRGVNAGGNSPYSQVASATTGNFSVDVNFGLASATDFYPGYAQDNSLVYADRGNGYSYGWDVDNTANARERNNAASPDKRFDTFTHFQKQTPTRVWEIAVPSGTYQVHIVCGEATAKDCYHRILVENTLVVNADTRNVSSNYAWAEGTGVVTVCDGRMTVKAEDGVAVNAKINFINITGVVPPALQVAAPPQNATVIETTPATFTVGVSGAAPFFYQWYRNGAVLPNETNATLSFEASLGDNNALYHAVISTCLGQTTASLPAQLSVTRDDFPPTLARAYGDPTLSRAFVVLSERVTTATATSLGNYSMADAGGVPLAISGVMLLEDRKTVALATASQTPGAVYTVTVNNLADLSPQANVLAPNSQIAFTAWVESPFFLTAEIFTNLANSDVPSLTNSLKFQNNLPDLRYYLTRFYWRSSEILPTAGLDNYGSRISGYFTPPSNGLYRFFLTSDDSSRLFMNTNAVDSANPAGKALIAQFDGARSYYTNNDASLSVALALTGGERYYVETLQKDGTGDDYVTVTFRAVPDDLTIPDSPSGVVPSQEAIGGAYLSGFSDPAYASLTVTVQPPASLSVAEDDYISLRSFGSAVPSNTPIFYVWQRYDAPNSAWVNVPGATSSNLSFYVPLGDDQAQYRVTLFTVGHQASFITTLHVTADGDPPSIVSVGSTDGRAIVVKFNERVLPNNAFERLNWGVTAQDGSYPEFTPTIRTNLVSGVERVYYDQVILTLQTPVTGNFLVEAFNMTDWATAGNVAAYSSAAGTVQNLIGQDVGTAGTDPIAPGGVFASAWNELDVAAGGSDIWNAADGLYYVYRPVVGNFDIKVRVNSLAAANTWSKAGLMARVSTNGNSRNISMLVAPPNGMNTFTFQWRDTDGATCGSMNYAAGVPPFNTPPAYPNAWVRLKRLGSALSGLISADGTNWTSFTNRDTAAFGGAYPTTVLLGLAVTAHDNAGANRMTLAEFRDLYFPAAPTITTQPAPASTAVPIHHPVNYAVVAASDPNAGPVNYQWLKDGVAIPGATAASFLLPSPAVTDSGVYAVVVANDGGGTISDPLTLTVVNQPALVVDDLIVTNACDLSLASATLTGNDTDPESDPLTLFAVSGIAPVTFTANFDDGLLPANTALYGGASIAATGGAGDSGCLHLTEAAGTLAGAFVLNDLMPGHAVGGFSARFLLRIGNGSANPADGFSFNLASDLVDGTSASAEEGVGTGLSVCIDNYDNGGGEAPALDVKYQNGVLGHVPFAKINSTRWIEMVIDLKTGGLLTVRYDGTNVCTDLPTGFAPIQGRFGLYARTGGEYETHWLDDLSITAYSRDTVAGGQVVLSSPNGTIQYTAPAVGCGVDEFFYLANDGQINGTVMGRATLHHPPLARADRLTAVTAVPSTVSLAKLQANDLNQDGLTLAFSWTQPSHGTLTIVGDVVTYTSQPGFTGTDSWTYSIHDGRYPASTATVTVAVSSPLRGPTANIVASEVRNGQFWARFAGVPNKTYRVETTTDVVNGPWEALTQVVAPRNGRFEITDTLHPPSAGQRYYRAVVP